MPAMSSLNGRGKRRIVIPLLEVFVVRLLLEAASKVGRRIHGRRVAVNEEGGLNAHGGQPAVDGRRGKPSEVSPGHVALLLRGSPVAG